ncbi:MAG TPA: PAS domain S-box protein, partial [Elusimicrobiales bacterium]|nr:PAS domain S-box protein [Elusimicrobiales bacterium]
MNGYAMKDLGLRRSEAVGKEQRSLFPPAAAAKQEKVLDEVFESRVPAFFEEEVVFPDGSSRWLDTKFVPLPDQDGGVRAVMGISRDITRRKRAETSLRDSETRYRTLFDQARDSIMVLEARPDEPPLILDANDAALRIHGYKREELVGRPITVLDAEEDAGALVEGRMRTIREKRSAEFEVVHRRKDGSLVVLEASVRAINVAGRDLLVDISRDLTERKRAERELRASERRYKTIFDSSSDPLMLLTPEGVFFKGNPAALGLFGCADEAEFTSMAPADLSPERQPDGAVSADKARKMMAIAMEKGSHFFEWTHKRVRGGEFFATVLLTRIDLDGRPVLQ